MGALVYTIVVGAVGKLLFNSWALGIAAGWVLPAVAIGIFIGVK